MTSLRAFKFVVRATVLVADDQGGIVGERESQDVVLYGTDSLRDFADNFPQLLASSQDEAHGARFATGVETPA